VLLGALAERLRAFGRVNTRKPDLVLGASVIQHRDRVAVRDSHDAARKGVRLGK
jgi:hypothetical protein